MSGTWSSIARGGAGDAGDEVMDEIHNREEPELQWMRLERRLIAMLQHRPSVKLRWGSDGVCQVSSKSGIGSL